MTNGEIIERLMRMNLHVYKNMRNLVDMFAAVHDEENSPYLDYALQCAKEAKKICSAETRYDSRFADLYWKNTFFLAPHDFDSYLLYMEKDRVSQKFYLPRRKQLKILVDALQDLEDGVINLLCISLPPGTGKALANDTPILTRNGWKNHGDLVVGDEVIGLNGEFKKVIAVHPKCQLDCLVEFMDGTKIVCHENHEWMVYDRGRKGTATFETKYLESRTLISGDRCVIQLPDRHPVLGEKKDLPLDPYTLGVWLGDGANKNPRIACDRRDIAVIERIKKVYPVRWSTIHKTTGVLYFDFDIRKQLQSMGMCHSRKKLPKHIPVEYLTASLEQRLDLLAGLLDTDGTLCGSKYIYSTTDEELRDTFADLVSTFGWRTCVHREEPCVSSSGVHGRKPVYDISFTPNLRIPCELDRKKNLEPHRQRRVGFKSITRIEPKEGNCITVEGDGMYLAGRKMIPTHNTTLALFYITWRAGKHHENPILTVSHNNAFLAGAYNECQRMMDPEGEYKWHEIFPNLRITSTNAKDMMLDIGKTKKSIKRFSTLEFTSIGSGNAGKVRARQLLYCDDLTEGIEQALSKPQMDKLWQKYTDDARQRKMGGCAELHIQTRWSVHDVVGRLQRIYGDSPTARFIAIPAMDENDESNFDYPIEGGFTTQFYREQREIMDDMSWKALYMNQPIEREGLLYPEDSIRRYMSLPDKEPDAIIGICDTKAKGTDYMFLPCFYKYGTDYYMEDCICSNESDFDIQYNNIADIIVRNRMQMVDFESNSGGDRVAENIEKLLIGRQNCGITMHYTTQNKETKIIVNAEWVKKHCLFKDRSKYTPKSDYGTAMGFLTSYTVAGKNAHDDVPDGLAQFAQFTGNLLGAKTEIMDSPF